MSSHCSEPSIRTARALPQCTQLLRLFPPAVAVSAVLHSVVLDGGPLHTPLFNLVLLWRCGKRFDSQSL
jgi:hypothetical protein